MFANTWKQAKTQNEWLTWMSFASLSQWSMRQLLVTLFLQVMNCTQQDKSDSWFNSRTRFDPELYESRGFISLLSEAKLGFCEVVWRTVSYGHARSTLI